MSFDVGAITGGLKFDMSDFTRGMLQAQSIASLMPGWVTAFMTNPLLGVIAVAKDAADAIGGAFLSVGREADNMGEAAQRAGVSVEFLSSVGKVAADSGSSVQGLGDALKFLANNAADAAAGGDTAMKAFASIGISGDEIKTGLNDIPGLFFQVADAVKGLESPALQTQAAMNLMGRGGVDMIPTLNMGSAAIKQMAQTITDLGGAVDSKLAAAGDKFGTLGTYVSASMDGMKKALAEPILEGLASHFDDILGFLKGSDFRPLLAEIGSAIGAMIPKALEFGAVIADSLGGAFTTLGPLIRSSVDLVGTLAETVGTILIPVFKLLQPVMEIVASILAEINQAIAGVLQPINEMLGGFGPSPAAAGGGRSPASNNYYVDVDASRDGMSDEEVGRRVTAGLKLAKKQTHVAAKQTSIKANLKRH